VERLSAVQHGDRIVLEWENPVRTVSGKPLVVAAVEVRAVEAASVAALSALRAADMEKRGKPVGRIEREGFPGLWTGRGGGLRHEHAFDGSRAGKTSFAFSVRVFDAKGRASEFCPVVAVETKTCPRPPVIGEVRVRPEALEVVWTAPEANIDGSRPAAIGGYLVYRREGSGPSEKRTPRPVAGTSFEDRDFRFGASYAYTVRALASGPGAGVESGDSEAAAVTPRDVFPPSAPAGLVAVAGPDAVSLSWEPAPEADLAGYKVWRKTEGEGGFVLLTAGMVRETVFTDPSARKGATYVYAVSAADTGGNESPRSESGPLTLKRSRP
jgi:hypothetical protein